jgi:hypothetical protein
MNFMRSMEIAMKLIRALKRKIKNIKIKIIINSRIILCKNVESENYLACLNCRRFQTPKCQTKFLNRVKWII